MKFPKITEQERFERLNMKSGVKRIVIDTDAYNEVDDQFAVVYALNSKKSVKIEALYAAPFLNSRASSPGDGMEKSYNELLNLMKLINIPTEGFVYKGSTDYLNEAYVPQRSAAAEDLVKRATSVEEEPLYVVAIGAITNVASAILMEPEIIRKIVVVWLSGRPTYAESAMEFNLEQDMHASKLIFNCGVPLIHIPCGGVTSHLSTTIYELEHYLQGKNEVAQYLLDIVRGYVGGDDPVGWSKVIWDIAAIAYLINPDWLPSHLIHSPILTDNGTWSFDNTRHFIREVHGVYRDCVYRDLFNSLK